MYQHFHRRRAIPTVLLIASIVISSPSLVVAQEPISEEFRNKSAKLAQTWVEYANSGPEGQRDQRLLGDLQNLLSDFLYVAFNQYPQAAETKRALDINSRIVIEIANQVVRGEADFSSASFRLENAKSLYDRVGLQVAPFLARALAEIGQIFQTRFDLDVYRSNCIQEGMDPYRVGKFLGPPTEIYKDQEGWIRWDWEYKHNVSAQIFFDKEGTVTFRYDRETYEEYIQQDGDPSFEETMLQRPPCPK